LVHGVFLLHDHFVIRRVLVVVEFFWVNH
jgi:hypothetical protein